MLDDEEATGARRPPLRKRVGPYARSLAPDSPWSLAPGVRDFRRYERRWLRADVLAGITVASLAVPQSLGMAELAGVPVVAGLYATLLPLLAYALFGSSRQLIVGPEGTLAALTAATVAPLAIGDPARYAALATMLALLVGGLLIVGGVLRLGFMADFFSKPILLGYINGIALTIIAGQLPKILGLDIDADDFFAQVAEIVQELPDIDWPTFALGGSLLAFVLVMRRVSSIVPATLIAVVGATAIVAIFDLEDELSVVGDVPRGLPDLGVPNVGLGDVTDLFLPAVGLALVSLADTIGTARTFAQKNGYELDSNRELVGLGAAGVASGLSQGFPVSSSGSRTAANDAARGKSQGVAVVAFAVVLLVLLFLAPLLDTLPTAALGAVVIAAAIALFDVAGFRELARVRTTEAGLALATVLGVLLFGVLGGVAVAVALSVGAYLYRAVRPHDAILGAVDDVDGWHDVARWPGSTTRPGLLVYRFDAPIFFPNAEYFRRRVVELVDASDSPLEWVLVNAESVHYLDATAVEALRGLHADLSERGVVLALARVKGAIRDLLERTGLMELIGAEHVYTTVRAGVQAFDAKRADNPPSTREER